MTVNPKISVIVPVYNVGEHLTECLGSIINQTLKEIEIICIDDGSTDNSMDILQSFAGKDDRVKVILQKQFGAAAARNKGLAAAKGEYISFVDSDDWIDGNFLETLYVAAKEKNADVARALYKSHYASVIKDSEINKKIINKFKEGKDLDTNEHSIVIWNAIYRLQFLRDKKIDFFDANLRQSHDVPFTARVTFSAGKMIPVIGTYYHYKCDIPNQLSVFSIRRAKNVMRANKITVNFLNSVEVQDKRVYLEAFKRVIWRYDQTLRKVRSLKGLNKNLLKAFVKDFIRTFNKCKYRQDLINGFYEEYFKFLINNDVDGYISDYRKQQIRSFLKNIFSIERKQDSKTIRILGVKFAVNNKQNK